MSHEIARVARDISLLTTKMNDPIPIVDDSISRSAVSTITTSENGCLEDNAVAIDSSPSVARRTWNSGTSALDNLVLSNVCALSSRLAVLADSVAAKIAVLHSGAPPVDLSKSQVPLLRQTSTEEMASIVSNLRKVEMQLLRADEIIDPEKKLLDLVRD